MFLYRAGILEFLIQERESQTQREKHENANIEIEFNKGNDEI